MWVCTWKSVMWTQTVSEFKSWSCSERNTFPHTGVGDVVLAPSLLLFFWPNFGRLSKKTVGLGVAEEEVSWQPMKHLVQLVYLDLISSSNIWAAASRYMVHKLISFKGTNKVCRSPGWMTSTHKCKAWDRYQITSPSTRKAHKRKNAFLT